MATASAEHNSRHLHEHSRPLAFQVFLWTVSLGSMLVLGLGIAHEAKQLLSDLPVLPPWILLLLVLNLFPLSGWHSSRFSVDQPVTTAAALVLPPIEAGFVAFLGGLDSRELGGHLKPSKAIFNRSIEALPTLIKSLVAHQLIHSPGSSLYILPVAILTVFIGTALNYVLVATAISLEHGYSVSHVARRLPLGTPMDFLLILLAGAVLGAMLATLYNQVHPWALLAFLAPILLGRQVLVRSQMVLDARRAFHSRAQALTELTLRISEERRDERWLIAADLHDEVLQPLFKVTLMAQVLKADLAHGRLLDIDEDLPELLTAAELASSTLRELIGDLRRSPLGTGGLTSAIGRLSKSVTDTSNLAVEVHCEPIPVDAASELVIYQIAKEALGNAVQHSQAHRVTLRLEAGSADVRLIVADDGVGFDSSAANEDHYGIHIMRERAASINAQFFVDSTRGNGCTVTLLVPRRGHSNKERG